MMFSVPSLLPGSTLVQAVLPDLLQRPGTNASPATQPVSRLVSRCARQNLLVSCRENSDSSAAQLLQPGKKLERIRSSASWKWRRWLGGFARMLRWKIWLRPET